MFALLIPLLSPSNILSLLFNEFSSGGPSGAFGADSCGGGRKSGASRKSTGHAYVKEIYSVATKLVGPSFNNVNVHLSSVKLTVFTWFHRHLLFAPENSLVWNASLTLVFIHGCFIHNIRSLLQLSNPSIFRWRAATHVNGSRWSDARRVASSWRG